MRNGFQQPDLEYEMAEICHRHNVDKAILKNQLEERGRFISFRGIDNKTYFSSHFMHAASYATRAPEFYWEALWSVYLLAHPHLGLDWNQSNDGHAWVLSQMQNDPPVVLHVEVPEIALGAEAERIRRYCEILPLDSTMGGCEVALVPSDNLQIVEQTITDYWIDGSLLRFLSDSTQEEIEEQVDEGLWGEPIFYHHTKYWLWTDVKTRLSATRLSHLNLC